MRPITYIQYTMALFFVQSTTVKRAAMASRTVIKPLITRTHEVSLIKEMYECWAHTLEVKPVK